jgi:hypothetical protein
MSCAHLTSRARLAAVLLGCAAPFAAALAQNAQPQNEPDKEAGALNQRIERIRIEDRGSRIDELRVGGETQNITVETKSEVPAYQVMPNGERSQRAGRPESSDSDGKRVWWDVFKF